MIIEFEKKYLSELYNIGQYISKTYTYNPAVVARYKARVDTLAAARSVEQLSTFKSWDVRSIDEEGTFSVRLDYSYCLIFKINTLTCTLVDIMEQE